MSNMTEQENALFNKVRDLSYEGNRSRILFVAAGVSALSELIDDLIQHSSSPALCSLSQSEINRIREKYIDELIEGAEQMSGDEIDKVFEGAQVLIDEE